jgi:hypothetical protein
MAFRYSASVREAACRRMLAGERVEEVAVPLNRHQSATAWRSTPAVIETHVAGPAGDERDERPRRPRREQSCQLLAKAVTGPLTVLFW